MLLLRAVVSFRWIRLAKRQNLAAFGKAIK